MNNGRQVECRATMCSSNKETVGFRGQGRNESWSSQRKLTTQILQMNLQGRWANKLSRVDVIEMCVGHPGHIPSWPIISLLCKTLSRLCSEAFAPEMGLDGWTKDGCNVKRTSPKPTSKFQSWQHSCRTAEHEDQWWKEPSPSLQKLWD